MAYFTRASSQAELNLIAEMAAHIWPITYGHIISPEQMDYMLRKFYNPQVLFTQLSDSRRILLLQDKNAILGYIDIEDRGADQFIHKFYLLISEQNKGLGTSAMQLLIAQENSSNKTLRLQVNRQNYQAINFYFKNGFVIETVLDLDIGNDFYMNDFLMVKHF